MSETFSDASIERAVLYLAEKASAYGKAKGLAIYLEHKLKIVEAAAFSQATGTMDERRSAARISKEYGEALEQYRDAVIEAETLRAYRNGAESKIACWQTLSANSRSRNV